MTGQKSREKIAMLGGSFNPPHIGHISLAQVFTGLLQLDRVLLIPTCIPPHKQSTGIANTQDRYNMCCIAARGHPAMEVSDIEIRRGGASYTADTLEALQKLYPQAALYLIMGADMFKTLQDWKDPQRIFKSAQVCTAPRNKTSAKELQAHARFLEQLGAHCIIREEPVIQVSSTQIRNTVKAGGNVAALTGKGVAQYIQANGLYKE